MNETKLIRYREDEIILKQGCTKKEMYKIISGKAVSYLNYGEADEYLAGVLSEQECFGEMGILCDSPSLVTIVAMTDVLLMRISEEDFDDFIKNNTKNAVDIMKSLAKTSQVFHCNMSLLMDELRHSYQSGQVESDHLGDILRRYTRFAPNGQPLSGIQV